MSKRQGEDAWINHYLYSAIITIKVTVGDTVKEIDVPAGVGPQSLGKAAIPAEYGEVFLKIECNEKEVALEKLIF